VARQKNSVSRRHRPDDPPAAGHPGVRASRHDVHRRSVSADDRRDRIHRRAGRRGARRAGERSWSVGDELGRAAHETGPALTRVVSGL